MRDHLKQRKNVSKNDTNDQENQKDLKDKLKHDAKNTDSDRELR